MEDEYIDSQPPPPINHEDFIASPMMRSPLLEDPQAIDQLLRRLMPPPEERMLDTMIDKPPIEFPDKGGRVIDPYLGQELEWTGPHWPVQPYSRGPLNVPPDMDYDLEVGPEIVPRDPAEAMVQQLIHQQRKI